MNVLFVAKPNSDNFIRNYSDHFGFLLVSNDVDEIMDVINDGGFDFVVFEWANDLTAMVVNNHQINTTVVVRIHDHEVHRNRIFNINWTRVDFIWFINKDVQAEFYKKIQSNIPSFFLPNCVNPDGLEENIVQGKNIGLMTISARTRKRLDRAFELMKLLPDYTLTIRTENYNPDQTTIETSFEYYHKSAPANVRWDLRNLAFIKEDYPRDDVNEFWHGMSYVISTSDHEGFHYQIAEAMLCGCFPVVYDWPFGRPRDFWSDYVHDDVESMAKAIQDNQPGEYSRLYVLTNFSPGALIPQLKIKFNEMKILSDMRKINRIFIPKK